MKLVHFRRQSNSFWYEGNCWENVVMKLEEPEDLLPENVQGWMNGVLGVPLNQTREIGGYNLDRLSKTAMKSISDFYAPDFERFNYSRWAG